MDFRTHLCQIQAQLFIFESLISTFIAVRHLLFAMQKWTTRHWIAIYFCLYRLNTELDLIFLSDSVLVYKDVST